MQLRFSPPNNTKRKDKRQLFKMATVRTKLNVVSFTDFVLGQKHSVSQVCVGARVHLCFRACAAWWGLVVLVSVVRCDSLAVLWSRRSRTDLHVQRYCLCLATCCGSQPWPVVMYSHRMPEVQLQAAGLPQVRSLKNFQLSWGLRDIISSIELMH